MGNGFKLYKEGYQLCDFDHRNTSLTKRNLSTTLIINEYSRFPADFILPQDKARLSVFLDNIVVIFQIRYIHSTHLHIHIHIPMIISQSSLTNFGMFLRRINIFSTFTLEIKVLSLFWPRKI